MMKLNLKKVCFIIFPLIALTGAYSFFMSEPALSGFKQTSEHAVSMDGDEAGLNFKVIDDRTIMINNIPSVVKNEYSKNFSANDIPPGAPTGKYLILETSAYIIAMKRHGGNTYIGIVKDLINDGEGNIWWKI